MTHQAPTSSIVSTFDLLLPDALTAAQNMALDELLLDRPGWFIRLTRWQEAAITIKETSRLTPEEIERMRKEAEEHAEEDRRKAEEVETRNQADMLIYTVEKTLTELGDKVPAAKRSQIEAAIRDLKEKLDKKADIASLRAAMEELKRVSGEVAAEAYRQAAGAGSSQDQGDQGKGDDYIDYKKE